jgi:hypothetical protein
LAAGPVAWGQALIKPYFIKKSDQQMKLEAEQSKKFFSRIGDEVTPSQFDLLKYQTPVKNQGKRGTCVAFASAAQVETLVKIKSGNTVDLSEQYIYWASKVASKVAPNQEGRSSLASDSRFPQTPPFSLWISTNALMIRKTLSRISLRNSSKKRIRIPRYLRQGPGFTCSSEYRKGITRK